MEMRPVGSEEFDSAVVVGAVGLRESSLMRNVNMLMRRLSGSFSLSDPIAFFGECRIPSCYSVVWMSTPVFDAEVMDSSEWLLAERHDSLPSLELLDRRVERSLGTAAGVSSSDAREARS